MDGSPTAHPMLIGRERNLPVICGVQGLVETMKPLDGQIITMDGLTKFIYQGKRELKAAS
jgi:phosphohistidine swiveling domain-containing protein